MQASPLISVLMSLFSVILPSKMWFSPSQPIKISVDSKTPTSLVLTKFDGSMVGTKDAPAAGSTVDLRTLFPELGSPGTYVAFAVPKGKGLADFVGTPVVIEVLIDKNQGGTEVVKVEPLRYEVDDHGCGSDDDGFLL